MMWNEHENDMMWCYDMIGYDMISNVLISMNIPIYIYISKCKLNIVIWYI